MKIELNRDQTNLLHALVVKRQDTIHKELKKSKVLAVKAELYADLEELEDIRKSLKG